MGDVGEFASGIAGQVRARLQGRPASLRPFRRACAFLKRGVRALRCARMATRKKLTKKKAAPKKAAPKRAAPKRAAPKKAVPKKPPAPFDEAETQQVPAAEVVSDIEVQLSLDLIREG